MLLRLSIATLALAFLILPAQARHVKNHHHSHPVIHPIQHNPDAPSQLCHGTVVDNDGRYHCSGGNPGFAPSPLEGRGGAGPVTHVRRGGIGNNESSLSLRGGYARVCVLGHCGTVAAYLAPNFRGLYAEFLAMGYNIGSPGCLSSGHMAHSLHHTGKACDLFDQYARNKTHRAMPPAAVQMEVAARHGLTAGAGWCNPDGGHFDTSGINGCRSGRNFAASRRHRLVKL